MVSMNDVDAITIPEGDVDIIKDSNGTPIWYKQQYQTIDLIPLCNDGIGYWNTTWTSCSGYGTDTNWVYSTWIPCTEGKIVYKAYMFSIIGHFTAWDANGVELGYRAGSGSGVTETGEWTIPTGTKYIRVSILNPDGPYGSRYPQDIKLICKSPLPRKYERLDSIVATKGTGQTGQYIDTGILPKTNHIINLSIQSQNPSADYCFFGMVNSGSFFGHYNSKWRIGSNIKTSNIPTSANRVLARAQGSTWDVDGQTDTCSAISTSSVTYYLFAAKHPSYGVLYGSARIWQLIIMTQKSSTWQFVGNAPEGFFIPARDRDTGELGMYDYVSGNFLTNLGTGSFTT